MIHTIFPTHSQQNFIHRPHLFKCYTQLEIFSDSKNILQVCQPCNINGFSLVQSEFLQPAQQTKWLLFHLSRLQGKDKNSPIINLTSLYFSPIDIGIHGYFTLKFSYLLWALCLKPFMGPKSVSGTIYFFLHLFLF